MARPRRPSRRRLADDPPCRAFHEEADRWLNSNVVIGWERPDRGTVEWAPDDAVGWARLAGGPQRLALIKALSLAESMALPYWSRPDAKARHPACWSRPTTMS